MKEESNESLEVKIAERNERAKKIYRYVSDVARRIGDATIACQSIADLFTTHMEIQRQKLRDNCEKLIFLDPLNYGKKSLELLWRKVYYDTVTTAKKLRETNADYDNYILTHIICGIGHFHHFITRIQLENKIQLKELDYMFTTVDEDEETLCEKHEEELQFAKSALHSCLIYLGDLSRYQTELFHSYDPSISARYYLQAALVDMNSGMPFNQLGNLYLERNYNIDSVCYYIHCLNCDTPFDGAHGNLTKIFEKNAQFCETMADSESLTPSEVIQNMIANFLCLIEIWYLNKNDTNIPQRCNTIAHELKMAMDFNKTPLPDINKSFNEYQQAVDEESINPSYLNPCLIHKMVEICLFTLAKVNEIDESKAFACKAFTLALLSQLLQKLLQHLESLGLKNPAKKYVHRVKHVSLPITEPESILPNETEASVTQITNGINTVADTNGDIQIEEILPKDDIDSIKNENGDLKISKKSLGKRRRRRRAVSTENSDASDYESETGSTISEKSQSDEDVETESSFDTENDSNSESSFTDSEGEAENEMNEPKTNGNVIEEVQDDLNKTRNETDHTNKADDVKDKSKSEEIENQWNENAIQDFLLGNNFLSSVKLLQDWVLSQKELILSCGDSGQPLFQCVVDLLNIFTHYFHSRNNNNVIEESKILDYATKVAKKLQLEYKTIPLPEDINLRGTNICKFDKDAAEWQLLDKFKPSVYEENVIRILNFIDFGQQIAKIVPQIRFNRTMKIYYFKKSTPPKLNAKVVHKKSREWHNSKKQHSEGKEGGLLRRLGRLWLASRVRELERSAPAAPALLALDAAALSRRLRRVKQLLRARAFVLLIPTVVLQELDELKREQSSARDAIRWLESQLRSGSRHVRAQRPQQSRPLPLLKYPRKAPPHVHNFIQILEFCNHFVADDRQGCGDKPLLILLTGADTQDTYKEFSVTGAAQSAGVTLRHIDDFYAEWRRTVHKSRKR